MKLSSKKSSKSIASILIIIYLLLATLYILFDFWTTFRENVIQQSFRNGQIATIQEIVKQADESMCKPFTVYNEEKQVQLLNTACLQINTPQSNTTTAPITTPKTSETEELTE